jgi:hypothetical protein
VLCSPAVGLRLARPLQSAAARSRSSGRGEPPKGTPARTSIEAVVDGQRSIELIGWTSDVNETSPSVAPMFTNAGPSESPKRAPPPRTTLALISRNRRGVEQDERRRRHFRTSRASPAAFAAEDDSHAPGRTTVKLLLAQTRNATSCPGTRWPFGNPYYVGTSTKTCADSHGRPMGTLTVPKVAVDC